MNPCLRHVREKLITGRTVQERQHHRSRALSVARSWHACRIYFHVAKFSGESCGDNNYRHELHAGIL